MYIMRCTRTERRKRSIRSFGGFSMAEASIVADRRNPDRLSLLSALGDGDNLLFVLEGKNTLQVYVDGIQREDGSGRSFNVSGRHASSHRPVKIYYHTDHRTGHVTFLS